MNSTLRIQNNVRDRFKRIWLKDKSMKNREAYVRHRNLLPKLRKQSLNKYLKDKCTINNTHNNKEFWKITKPFMSHKGSSANTDISLIENDAIINDVVKFGFKRHNTTYHWYGQFHAPTMLLSNFNIFLC